MEMGSGLSGITSLLLRGQAGKESPATVGGGVAFESPFHGTRRQSGQKAPWLLRPRWRGRGEGVAGLGGPGQSNALSLAIPCSSYKLTGTMTCDLKIAALWFNMPLTFLCPIYGVLMCKMVTKLIYVSCCLHSN